MTATAIPGTILRTADERHYLADDHAPHAARLYIRETLAQWNLEHLSDDAQQIVSELAANAATAARGTIIGVELQQTPDSILIKVRDDNPAPPAPQDPGLWSEHGRGLLITHSLSSRTGHYATATAKIVWSELRIQPVTGHLPIGDQRGGPVGTAAAFGPPTGHEQTR